MERTSTRPLTIQKTICRRHKPKGSKRVVMTETQVTEGTNIKKTQNTSQARHLSSLLNHLVVGQSESEHYARDAESNALHGLVTMLENCDGELKFIAAHASVLESARKDDNVYDVKHIKAEDESRASPEFFYAMTDSEMMLETICCDDHVLPSAAASVLEDKCHEYFHETNHHETNTLSTRCRPTNLLGHCSGVVPHTTASSVEERNDGYVHSILMEEIQMNRDDNYSVQSWTYDGDRCFVNEHNFQCFQSSSRTVSEKSDEVVLKMLDAEQAEDGNDIYVDQGNGEYPDNENCEVDYDDDVWTAGE